VPVALLPLSVSAPFRSQLFPLFTDAALNVGRVDQVQSELDVHGGANRSIKGCDLDEQRPSHDTSGGRFRPRADIPLHQGLDRDSVHNLPKIEI